MPGLWNARSQYYAANPNVPNPLDPVASGLGFNFTSTGGTSSGTSGSSSKYSSGSSGDLQAYMKYALTPQFTKAKTVSLTNPFNVKQKAAPANILKAYQAQQAQLYKALAAMPQISTKDIPKLKLPKIDSGKINFKTSPEVPSNDNARIQAGRITRLGGIL